MIIKNAKIKNVTAGRDSEKIVCVSMEFHYSTHFKIFVFKLENPVELRNFKELLEFTEATEFKDLEGKVIRVAEHNDVITAIGDLIEDKFVDVTNKMSMMTEIVSEATLLKNYPETK